MFQNDWLCSVISIIQLVTYVIQWYLQWLKCHCKFFICEEIWVTLHVIIPLELAIVSLIFHTVWSSFVLCMDVEHFFKTIKKSIVLVIVFVLVTWCLFMQCSLCNYKCGFVLFKTHKSHVHYIKLLCLLFDLTVIKWIYFCLCLSFQWA